MGRSLARDHDEKRERILAAAARVFAAEGFDRASMSRLAAACGISKANIYHYYDSKDALLFDILDSHLSALRDRVVAAAREAGTPEERLRHVVTEILLAYRGADDAHRLQIGALTALPEAEQEVLRGYQREIVSEVSAILAALAPHLAEDRARLRATTMSLFGMLNWHYMWNRDESEEGRRAYAALVTELMLHGVGERR